MTDVNEQRFCVKFCFKLGKTTVEGHKWSKDYKLSGDEAMGQS